MNKEKALAKYLNVKESEITIYKDIYKLDDGRNYKIFTDEEANNAVYDFINDNIWIFDPEFILEQSDIKYTEETKTSLTKMLNSCTNDCNSFILAFIESTCGIDYFVESAIKHNGRSFFIAFFDNPELHIDEDLFAYQLN